MNTKRRSKKILGKKVFVYRNLHRSCFSVKDCSTGLVIAHVDTIVLENCQFKVSQAGRARVLKEKRKNVHAGVVGVCIGLSGRDLKTAVGYNPYKYENFVVRESESKITEAKKVVIGKKGLTASL
jgi:hypothetical protein